MTQEQKQLLLKDLCARLPYGTIIQVKDWAVLDTELEIGHINQLQNDDLELKPYLRPMSSMTPDERKEYDKLIANCLYDAEAYFFKNYNRLYDWLLVHHFDYRGLISMGVALEAPADMYKTE